MTSTEMIARGAELMLFGMGFVFCFLVLLIVCVRLMSSLVGRLEGPQALQLAPVESPSAHVDDETFTAIRIALQRHRARRG
ncbi:OadG family protein [Stutzerimonas tarimensis]|uniref:Probable oxaloacetate decarboxylase gamma chain n=1 Tax=Stutzerimonas tarimensis TaxID=1507735 RepID=A0ABV7TCR3_9GAMM